MKIWRNRYKLGSHMQVSTFNMVINYHNYVHCIKYFIKIPKTQNIILMKTYGIEIIILKYWLLQVSPKTTPKYNTFLQYVNCSKFNLAQRMAYSLNIFALSIRKYYNEKI